MLKDINNNTHNNMKKEKWHIEGTCQAKIHLILTKEKAQIQAEIKLNNNSKKWF